MPDPIDPAILGAAMGGGGKKPSTRIKGLQEQVDFHLGNAREAAAHAVVALQSAQAAAEQRRDAAWEATFGPVINRVNKGLTKARKASQMAETALNDRVQDHLNATRKRIQSMGGEMPALYDEIAAYNALGEHDRLALERIILPALKQHEEALKAGDELDSGGPLAPAAVPPIPPETPPSDATCPSGYVRGIDPTTGQPAWLCPGADIPVVPISPAPPPTVPPPPNASPPPPPPPPSEDCECPVPQLVIRIPGCPDIPVGSVPTDGPLPPPPPTDGESPPPPPPPKSPPPPAADPPPPPPVPKLDPKIPEAVGGYDGPNFCIAMDHVAAWAGSQGTKTPPIQVATSLHYLASTLDALPFGIGKALSGISHAAVDVMAGVIEGGKQVATAVGINSVGAALWDISLCAVPGMMDQWLGTDTSYYLTPIKQAAHYINPVNLLGQTDADACYLAGVIDQAQWTCYTRAAGNLPWHYFKNIESKRTRQNIGEIVTLRMRKWISEEEFYDRMRGEGVMRKSEAFDFLQLATQLPTISDLMRYQAKDVENEEYIRLANLDEGFEDSWTPALNSLALAQGITPEQIRWEYRASWQDVPLTQIYQMFWRLRPGRVSPELAFTEEQAKLMMKIQEVQPGFRNRLLAVAYQPINRTDLMAAYVAGTMDLGEVRERLMDLGYSPLDSRVLADMLKAKGDQQQSQSIGAWTRRKIIQNYVTGALTRVEADRLLSRTIYSAERRTTALDDADTVREAQGRGTCIKGYKRRYMTGEWTVAQTQGQLLKLNVDMGVALELLATWGCERNSKSKEPTVQMLTEWVEWGIITWDQFGDRMRNLGYTEDDTIRIRVATDLRLRKKAAKEAEQARDRAERKARQKKKDQEEAAKPKK